MAADGPIQVQFEERCRCPQCGYIGPMPVCSKCAAKDRQIADLQGALDIYKQSVATNRGIIDRTMELTQQLEGCRLFTKVLQEQALAKDAEIARLNRQKQAALDLLKPLDYERILAKRDRCGSDWQYAVVLQDNLKIVADVVDALTQETK